MWRGKKSGVSSQSLGSLGLVLQQPDSTAGEETVGRAQKTLSDKPTAVVLTCTGIFHRLFVVDLEGKPLSAAATLWPQPELHSS